MFFKLVIHSTKGTTNSDIKFFTALEGSQFLEELGCRVLKSTRGETIYSADVMMNGESVTDAFSENTPLLARLLTTISDSANFNHLGENTNTGELTAAGLASNGFIPVRFEVVAEWV